MSKTVRRLITAVAVVVLIVSASKIGWHYYQLYVGARTYEDIRVETVTEIEDAETVDDFSTISIDFDALYNINPDIIAWLYIPDTPVSYPVLRGANNQTYLRTTYDKKSNILGSIFQDYRNDADFQDLNTVVYGHNTSNDSMFGSLKQYKQQDYASQHTEVQIIRKDEVLVYEVFSVYETLATSDTYTIKFSSDETYLSYLSKMLSQSVVEVGSLPVSEHIITLSTCTGGNKTMRLVLQARLAAVYPTGPPEQAWQ